MPRTSLVDVRGIQDPLLQYNFDLFITNMPVGDTRALAVQCMTAMVPGIGTEPVPVILHGIETGYAGRPMYTHKITITFIETRAMLIRNSMRAWIEFCRNARTNTGAYKIDYEGIGDLVLYDDVGNAVKTVRMFGFYPEKLGDPSVDGASSQPVQYDVEFHLDYHVDL